MKSNVWCSTEPTIKEEKLLYSFNHKAEALDKVSKPPILLNH